MSSFSAVEFVAIMSQTEFHNVTFTDAEIKTISNFIVFSFQIGEIKKFQNLIQLKRFLTWLFH